MRKYPTKLLILVAALIFAYNSQAQQTLSISECHQLAIEKSPIQKKKLYLETIYQLNSDSYKSINYPKLMLNAQATYQSDVFSLPIPIPGMESPIIPQEQYKIAIDLYQNIYNGGVSKRATEIENAKMAADLQALDVTFQQVKEVINSLFFGALKAQEQIRLIEVVKDDLGNQLKILEAANKEGVVLSSSLKILEKEILTLETQLIEIRSAKESLEKMLSDWIEQPIENIELLIPDVDTSTNSISMNRAESKLFNSHISVLESQKNQLTSNRIPDIGLFGTAGVGNPNPLNWFDVEFTPYYLVGLKLSWDILDYGKTSRNREVLTMQQNNLMAEKENFERTLRINASKQMKDIEKYEAMMINDDQIVKLQDEIIAVADSQLKNGTITTNDYVMEVNKGLNARINQKLHEIDLAKSKIEYLTTTGNTEGL